MNATTLLKSDHSTVKKLFATFAGTSVRAAKRRQTLIDKIAEELEIHSTVEEEIFYPAVKGVRGGQSLVSEAKSEHDKLDVLVTEAQGMSMDTEEVADKVKEATGRRRPSRDRGRARDVSPRSRRARRAANRAR
jgi:hypothetical protein